MKKKQRDRTSYASYATAVAEELGDVLWYLAAVGARSSLSLSDVAANLGRTNSGRTELAWTDPRKGLAGTAGTRRTTGPPTPHLRRLRRSSGPAK